MRFIDKLIKKRDIAKAEYDKWQTLIDMMHHDPDFGSLLHQEAATIMSKAKREVANAKANGRPVTPAAIAAKRAWASKSPAERKRWIAAIQAARVKAAKARAKAESQ